MWRVFGDWLYSGILLVIFTIQATAIGLLTWAYSTRLLRQPLPLPAEIYLQLGVVLTALSLVGLTIYILVYHIISHHLHQSNERENQEWLLRWSEILMNPDAPPPPQLTKTAVVTLINLLQTFKGEEKRILQTFAQTPTLKEEWLRQLHARRISVRLNALEALSTVGLPEFFPPVIDRLYDKNLAVRSIAVKSAARILSQIPKEQQTHAAEIFADALYRSNLSSGIFKEALSLAEDALVPVLTHLLSLQNIAFDLLLASITIVGRLRLLEFSPQLKPYLDHATPEIRAAALSTFAQLDYLPADTWETVLRSATAPLARVRIQAVRALALIPPEQSHSILWKSLADKTWGISQAAGGALIHQGEAGIQLLRQALESHPDSHARHTALQSLMDYQLFSDVQFEEWIWAQT